MLLTKDSVIDEIELPEESLNSTPPSDDAHIISIDEK